MHALGAGDVVHVRRPTDRLTVAACHDARVAISRRLLNEGEHVVVSTRTHVKALLLPALWLILVAALAGYVSTFTGGAATPSRCWSR